MYYESQKLLSFASIYFSMKNPEKCPKCQSKLHQGEHKFSDGKYSVLYCKNCGFRLEKPF